MHDLNDLKTEGQAVFLGGKKEVTPKKEVNGVIEVTPGKLGNIKSIVSLEKDVYIGTCYRCGKMETLCWQITNFQDEYADVCQDCGMRIQEEIRRG